MIVKVQRALFPPDAPALLYDRKRQHSEMRDLDDELRRVLGDRPKAYCEATWDAARRVFTLGEAVDDQPW